MSAMGLESMGSVVRVKRKYSEKLSDNEDKLASLFGVKLEIVAGQEPCSAYICYNVIRQSKLTTSTTSVTTTSHDKGPEDTQPTAGAENSPSVPTSDDLTTRVQVRGSCLFLSVDLENNQNMRQ